MINIDYIKDFFPAEVQSQRLHMLREYLQCVMLEILFESPIGRRLTFLGGTCLRIVYGSQRFSEDLDFDNDGLTESEFAEIKLLMERELTLRGYEVEVGIKGKTAYRCEVKYPQMLYPQGISQIRDEKLLIQIDTQAQNFEYPKERFILNRFGVLTELPVTPMSVILSQKCYAILNRPRNKGRDFFDVVFLLSRNIKPDYAYLEQKLGIITADELKQRVLDQWATLNVQGQIDDVQGFLFNKRDEKTIRLFGEVFKQANLG
ncbi:nucleotidyl transferase AbiEii/AbiGii toxin family protein [Runella sp.]|uniref:nucleotidyl transferase AbiEii/AbiGii toxin family protein n=1 Tax=Runella sp. TaxID=1960881 RepID=UPI0030186844